MLTGHTPTKNATFLKHTHHHHLLVDPVLPDLLLSARRVSACAKNSLHLLNTSEEDLPRDEPADTLSARRTSQATLVGPELVEEKHRVEKRHEIHFSGCLDVHLVEANHGWELIEKGRVGVTRVEADGHDGCFVARGVDVDEM